jgi:16S rRNA (adenine1518-N6/adenine1519-N6)-dimethyltransferase
VSARERILALMNEFQIEPKKSLGQNFLISDYVIDKILLAVRELNPASLIEVGPGLGALTVDLRAMNVPLFVIELDRVFAEHWRTQGVNVVEEDALRWDWSSRENLKPCVLVSNLPFQISSSLVVDRTLDNSLDAMVLMFQKEVAQRLKARFKTDSYGMLSVLAQTFWDVDLVLEASSGDFLPPPKVASRVLRFKKKAQTPVQDRKTYLRFLKACFLHPRKIMLSNLVEALGQTREAYQETFAHQKLKPTARAQELDLKQFVALYLALGYT